MDQPLADPLPQEVHQDLANLEEVPVRRHDSQPVLRGGPCNPDVGLTSRDPDRTPAVL